MTRQRCLTLILASLTLMPLLAACDVLQCWLINIGANDYNPRYLDQVGEAAAVAALPVYLAISPDGRYVAVSSYGNNDPSDPNGVLSLIDVDGSGASRVSQITVGTRPYGLLWLSEATMLVCNEGQAGIGGNAPLQLITLKRGSEDPDDDAYDDRSFGDPNDPNYVTSISPATIVGPSEAALVPGTSAIGLATLRFPAGLYQIGLTSSTPTQTRLLPTVTSDPLDEPRGIAVTPDGQAAWICNYGKGANNRAALALARNLAAAKLNQFLVPIADPNEQQPMDAADAWLTDNQDADGELPYRWPEPDEGPGDQAEADAETLSNTITEYNDWAAKHDPNDPNDPNAGSPEHWYNVDTADWPTDPNLGADDPNDPNVMLVLGDPGDADHRYMYAEVAALFAREVEEQGVVTIYSLSRDQVIGTITVPPRPRSIRFTPDGSQAVVTCSGHDGESGSVVIISATTLTVTIQRDFDFVPALVRIHPRGTRAYISAWTGNQMAVINLAGLRPTDSSTPIDTKVRIVIHRPAAIDTSPANYDQIWAASLSQNQAMALDVFEGLFRIGNY